MYEFKVSELAVEFGVHRNTIRNWIQSGFLPASPGPGRKYCIKTEEYLALCEKYHITPKIRDTVVRNGGAPPPPKSDTPPLSLPHQPDRPQFDSSYFAKCIGCGSCGGACPVSGVEGLDPRKIMRALQLGLVDETVHSKWAWKCTLCAKCEESCPAGLEITSVMLELRKATNPKDRVAAPIYQGIQTCLATGNNLGIPTSDFVTLCTLLGDDLAAEQCPGFVTPIDVIGARVLVTVNSKEPFAEPDNLKWWWRIFHAAGESWTIPSDYWEGINWAYFTANNEAMRVFTGRLIDAMRRLQCQVLLLPECGHAYYAVRHSLETWFPEVRNEFQLITVMELLLDYINSGRITLRQTPLHGKATYHDSCHYSRKSQKRFGQCYDKEARDVVRSCVNEFVELQPHGLDNYCCGGGGGSLALPMHKERVFAGRLKARQISESGAELVVTACHNCRDQLLKSLCYEYDLNVEIKYLWELVADSLSPAGA